MSNFSIPHSAENGKVQTGPLYVCPHCGAACSGVDSAQQAHAPFGVPDWLTPWADHVGYLRRPRRCRDERHPGGRVARLGAAILPVDWPDGSPVEEKVTAIRQAIDAIARQIGPQGAPHDPAASIVYRLLAGVLSPQHAIDQIRELAHFGVLGALDVHEPGFALQEVAR